MPSELTLIKPDNSTPWGFRLHGGLDFGSPLTIQRINPGSVAAKCGLQIGDCISKINGVTTTDLKHKEAQDLIVKGGNSILLTICRGAEIPVRNDAVDSKSTQDQKYVTSESKVVTSISDNNNLPQPFNDRSYDGLVNKLFSVDISTVPTIPANPPPEEEIVYKAHPITITPKPTKATKLTPMGATSLYENTSVPKSYTPSDTYKYLKDLESGVDMAYSPKTGSAVKSTPIQSKLVDMLEKKQATFSNEPIESKTSTQSDVYISKPAASITIPSRPAKKVDPPASIVQSAVGQNMSANAPSKAVEPDVKTVGGVALCNVCNQPVRGKYVVALNKVWCPEHFLCSNPACQRPLQDIGFVQEKGQLYCAEDYEKFFAPRCSSCQKPIIGNAVKAIGKTFHPECFVCKQCNQAIVGGSFHLNKGDVYCDKDFSSLFLTKCIGCQFPIEAGDNWIEALNQNWHGECFNCNICHCNLENQGFINKFGKPYCREHAAMAKP